MATNTKPHVLDIRACNDGEAHNIANLMEAINHGRAGFTDLRLDFRVLLYTPLKNVLFAVPSISRMVFTGPTYEITGDDVVEDNLFRAVASNWKTLTEFNMGSVVNNFSGRSWLERLHNESCFWINITTLYLNGSMPAFCRGWCWFENLRHLHVSTEPDIMFLGSVLFHSGNRVAPYINPLLSITCPHKFDALSMPAANPSSVYVPKHVPVPVMFTDDNYLRPGQLYSVRASYCHEMSDICNALLIADSKSVLRPRLTEAEIASLSYRANLWLYWRGKDTEFTKAPKPWLHERVFEVDCLRNRDWYFDGRFKRSWNEVKNSDDSRNSD